MLEDVHLSSVKDIKERLKKDHKISIKSPRLLRLLHHDLNLRYKKINATSWQGNSAKNIILRQSFAKAFLKIDLTKKRIINIDETWLGMTDFRRMKWCAQGSSNSKPKKNMQPRVTMITALDTQG